MVKRKTLIYNVSVVIGVSIAYIIIRAVWKPLGGFGRFYATDVLFGMALPSLFYLCAVFNNKWLEWVSSLRGKIILIVGASILWEGVIPFLIPGYTGDIVDVACYVGGTLIQHYLSRLFD